MGFQCRRTLVRSRCASAPDRGNNGAFAAQDARTLRAPTHRRSASQRLTSRLGPELRVYAHEENLVTHALLPAWILVAPLAFVVADWLLAAKATSAMPRRADAPYAQTPGIVTR
jgi:hypothetical protein